MEVPARWQHLISVSAESGCWLWTGTKDRDGYGKARGKRAHRVLYETVVGPIPAGLHIDHLCRVRHCVNRGHMEPVSQRENQRGGLSGVLKTHCPAGHAYDEANTYLYRGARFCRACNRRAVATYQRRQTAESRLRGGGVL
jgi:HNH endonuclease